MENSVVTMSGVSKSYGSTQVLHDIDFHLNKGEIVGLIGPNGAGKSTLLKCILGLVKYSGDLSVFGLNPVSKRTEMLEKMSYIADVASLPSWMKVADLLAFVRDTHPQFEMQKAVSLLKDTPIELSHKVEALSKGMKTRLHLAIILAVNTDLLILDEPTLGLDVLVRRDFQDRLVQDYYNQQRSILITTHQIDEIESILTRVVFIAEGRISLDLKLADLKTRYRKLITDKNILFADTKIKPIYQRQLPEQTEFIFVDVDDESLREHGEVIAPSLEDLFVATNSKGMEV